MRNYRYVALANETNPHADPKDCYIDIGTWVEANNPREAVEVILKSKTDWYDFPGFEPSIELTRTEQDGVTVFKASVDAHGLGFAEISVEDITDLIDHETGIIHGSTNTKEEREAMH